MRVQVFLFFLTPVLSKGEESYLHILLLLAFIAPLSKGEGLG